LVEKRSQNFHVQACGAGAVMENGLVFNVGLLSHFNNITTVWTWMQIYGVSLQHIPPDLKTR